MQLNKLMVHIREHPVRLTVVEAVHRGSNMGDIKWRDDTVTDENMNEIDPDYRFGTRAREKVTEAAGNTLEWLNNHPD